MDNTVNTNIIPASASLDVTTLLATPSTSVKVERANNGVIAKMPVLIGKTIIQLYVDALANFEEPALEITNIKHDLNLTGCEFIQVESATKGKLIMSGYIREYIDYTVANVGVDGFVSIGSRRTGMDIPFKCFTKIELDSEPELSTSDSVLYNEEEALITPIGANENYLHYSSSNEGLNFEVVETKIRQVHIKQNTDNVTISNYGAETFSSLSINMALDVALIILQDQFVAVSASGNSGSNNQSSSNNSSNGSSNSQSNNGKSSSSNNSSNNNNNKGNKKSSSKWSKYGWMKLW